MMEGSAFELGHVYWATPVWREQKKRMVIVIGREHAEVQFAFVDTFASASLIPAGICGREFCKLQDRESTYNCSSVCELDAANAAQVYESIRNKAQR